MSLEDPENFLVEDSISLRRSGFSSGICWSTSTGLPYVIKHGDKVRSPESLIRYDEYQSLGKSVLCFAEDARVELGKVEETVEGLQYASLTHAAQIYYGALLIAYKAMLLDKWIAAVGKGNHAVIGSPDLEPVSRLSWLPTMHDHIFAALADKLESGPSVKTVPRIDPTLFNNSFGHVPVFDRFFNIVSRTPAAIAHQIWVRAGSPRTPGWRGTILNVLPTELVEESFLSLAFHGWRIGRLEIPRQAAGPALSGLPAALEKALRLSWNRNISPHLSTNVNCAAWALLWPRFSQALRNHAPVLARTKSFVTETLAKHGHSNKPVVFFSSGLYAPAMRLLDACLREAGATVVCVDHGAGQGLGLRHDFTARYAISFSDEYLAFNEQTKKQFQAHLTRPTQNVHIVGAPNMQITKRLKGIKRFAARRHLGVSPKEPLLLYVTSLTNNNIPIGYGTSTDLFYARFQKKLLDVLGRFNGRVIVKPYPAHRYADPEQIWQIGLADNTSVAPFGEFRHLRWAPDILLLDLCSSTLGWAISTDVPLIYVDNESNSMTGRAAREASKALNYIDAHSVGWEGRLGKLIDKSPSEFQQNFAERKDAREQFDREFVTGPRGVLKKTLHGVLNKVGASPHRA